MSTTSTAAMLRATADAIDAGLLPEPYVSIQVPIYALALPGQDAALRSAAGLFPGLDWDTRLVPHRVLSPALHMSGERDRFRVTISATAQGIEAATAAEVTGTQPQQASGQERRPAA